jgi:hypothetical protein
MLANRLFIFGLAALLFCHRAAANAPLSDDNPLMLPAVGAHQLRILSPTLLELTLITTKKPDPAPIEHWDFVDERERARLPAAGEFLVTVDGKTNPVTNVGFKRRVLYAPLKERDLRIGNYLYLQLGAPIADNASVSVANPSRKLWPPATQFSAKADPLRWSPALHVNQVGYLPAHSKKAMAGYFLGSMGEMDLTPPARAAEENTGGSARATGLVFQLVEARSHKEVFQGTLVLRPDRGFPFSSYQRVWEADFTDFKNPGEYKLVVPGMGASFPFFIDEGVAAALARAYALGIYHQRCGGANEMPFTRFTHGPCHTAPAEVPTTARRFELMNDVIGSESANAKDMPRHTAPPMKTVADSLYPFVNRGPVDVRGGHHDAGDYSKYTVNSASFIHHLVFAADAFPGVSDLDNLGLPESGDGKSDVLQLAKWEADFLAKMQDADGGFYFLVYPRDRRYEEGVLPDKGDPQIVWPKNTAVTAAAVAALAQCASSPKFKEQFPESAALYLDKAKKGWAFLERAIAKHGADGAYQKITHYGNEFMHDDELAWAACEMFLATGDTAYQKRLMDGFDPADPGTRRWNWWRMYEAYGCAIRSYAFAARSGRLKPEQLQRNYLERCEAEIEAAGQDQLRRAQASAYGTSFPDEGKKARTAGWYYSSDAAFDLAVAYQLQYPVRNDPRPRLLEAMLSNMNYEAGCNPVNVTYITGLGSRRQREIVHLYAQNDHRVLPPSGIPLGNLQAGFGWLDRYGKELGRLSFPSDSDPVAPYPLYDRWGDSFNLSTEFVILNQARGLGYLAWLMAQTPLKNQKWKSATAQITGLPPRSAARATVTAAVTASGLDLSQARVVWEAHEQEPVLGSVFRFAPASPGPCWVEVEAQLPDGRRVVAATNVIVTPR